MSGTDDLYLVRFDQQLAAEAVSALQAAAEHLERDRAEHSGLAQNARDQWKGRYADQFDGEFAAQMKDAQRLIAEMQGLIKQINDTAAWATAESAKITFNP